MIKKTKIEYEINGAVYIIDLAEIDELVAKIKAGPGQDIGENIFDAFASCEIVELGDSREYIKDDAGVDIRLEDLDNNQSINSASEITDEFNQS